MVNSDNNESSVFGQMEDMCDLYDSLIAKNNPVLCKSLSNNWWFIPLIIIMLLLILFFIIKYFKRTKY